MKEENEDDRKKYVDVIKKVKLRLKNKAYELYKINRLFEQNLKRIYQELDAGKEKGGKTLSDAEENKTFWGKISSQGRQHEIKGHRLKTLKRGLESISRSISE